MSAGTAMAAAGLWMGSLALSGWWCYGAGRDAEIAAQTRDERAIARASDAAASAVAVGLAKLTVRHTTIRQELEREIQTREVYRDCHSGPDAVRLLNATAGAAAASAPPGAGELPAVGAADR